MTKKIKSKEVTGSQTLSFIRGIKLGFINFWRNKFLSIATIVVMAIIIFIFNIILAVQFVGDQALKTLSQRVDIVLYLEDSVDFFVAQKITEDLIQIEGVKNVKYTSSEEALDIVGKTHPQTAEFLRKFNLENPLPPSISITTESPEDHAKINEYLTNSEYARYLENYVTEEAPGESVVLSTVAKNLEQISAFVRHIIFWMVFVFIIGGTLIVVNAIQITIFSRKEEIHIMRLVGATYGFMRLPYIFEAILYAVAAVVLSFIILGIIGQSINLDGTNLMALSKDLNLAQIFVLELLVTLALAVISSFSAAEKHIKGNLVLH